MFTHLHIHTEYSMLDGISRIPNLVSQTKALGMDSLAITDHGSLYGAVDFYSECKEQGIKPIIGCEVYVAHNNRFDKGPSERSPFHMVLLAKNNVGYKNLMQLVTKSHLEGFHYRPRIDKDLLIAHSEGLICLSGCPSAEVPKLISDGNLSEAIEVASWYKDLFGEDYFLELQRHSDVPMLPDINKGLVEISSALDIPLVVTNDAHYVNQEDAPYQDVYICIQTSTNIQDEQRLRMEDNSYYIKSPQEMSDLFSDFPEAIANTQVIADRCNVELGFGETHLPKYETPGNVSADDYLAELCWEGFKEKYPSPTNIIKDRLNYELDVIKYTQFANYFLCVWDIIDFVRRSNIFFGVRGSAAASVALYCLGITEVDPLEYKLVFERFLNRERKEMPDIDMDFQDDRRDEVLHYVIDRYGSENVAQIITFGTMGAKAALRDVGRGLGMPYGDVDRIAKMVPLKCRTLDDAMVANPELQESYDTDSAVKALIENAKGLEGIVHHVSTHAAGVLISDEPLTDTVPLQRPARGDENSPVMMTQYSMDPVAKLGLLKMDFLGLTSLSVLDKTTRLIEQSTGNKIDLSDIPLDDNDTFKLLSSGKTTECFQLESAGMQRYIAELQPSNLGDIAAMIALYRPGPMEHIDTFINAKHGKIPIEYPHASLKELLDETYGVIVYQDQVLLILQSFAGYTLGEADTVRKAMGKKIGSLMAQEKERFIQGANKKGFDETTASAIFSLIEPFAGYAFNKAHSVSYGLISYWTAYFKTHHPVEYMASVLNSRLDNPEKVLSAINESSKLDIPVLLPDINRSEELFCIDNKDSDKPSLRFGLSAIKTVGESAVKPIVTERKEKGPFTSIDDFCRRADISGLNRRTLEGLIKAGAFDSLGDRQGVLNAIDQILATGQLEATMRNTGQTNMFDTLRNNSSIPNDMNTISIQNLNLSNQDKAIWEKEYLGSPISYNPVVDLTHVSPDTGITEVSTLKQDLPKDKLTFVGHIGDITERYTREQKKFLIVSLQMLDGLLELIVWPDILAKTDGLWRTDIFVRVSGKLRSQGDQLSLSCEEASEYMIKKLDTTSSEASTLSQIGVKNGTSSEPIEETLEVLQTVSLKQSITLQIKESSNPLEDTHRLRELVQLLREYQGQDTVRLKILTNSEAVLMDLPVITTKFCDDLKSKIEIFLGPNTVSVGPQ